MNYIGIKSWTRHQHYKERAPLWIKLYKSVLNDFEIMEMSESNRWLLVGIWLLSSETNGAVPCKFEWIRARLCTGRNVEQRIKYLESQGFVKIFDSKSLAECYSREEKEKRREDSTPIVPLERGIPFGEIIDDLNARAGTEFKTNSKVTRKWIAARWDEGHRLGAFRDVHSNMVKAWKSTAMEQYLRPSTLYRASKFENYLNYKVQDVDRKVTGSQADDISF